MKKLTNLFFVLVLIVLAACGNGTQGAKKVIKVGLFVPLTGALAFMGEGYQQGAELALKDLNGTVAGYSIELVVADNKGNPTDAVNATHKLIEGDQVDVMIGGGASSATLAALPVIAEGKVPTVDASSTNPSIYNQMGIGGNKWMFRINPDDLIMGGGFAEYIAQNTDTISFVADDNQFGHGAGKVYVPLFPTDGVRVVSEDYFDPGTTDYRPALTHIKAGGAKAIIIVMTDQSCATFMRQFREVGLEMKVFGRGSCTTGLFNDLTKDDPKIGEGIVEFSFFSAGQDPVVDEHLFETYKLPSSGYQLSGYYAMYYVVANAIKQLAASGKDVTRANLRDSIATLNIKTPAGPIAFDDHNQAYTDGTLTTNRDGKPFLLDTLPLKPVDHNGY